MKTLLEFVTKTKVKKENMIKIYKYKGDEEFGCYMSRPESKENLTQIINQIYINKQNNNYQTIDQYIDEGIKHLNKDRVVLLSPVPNKCGAWDDGIAKDYISESLLKYEYIYFTEIPIEKVNLKYWEKNNWQ